MKLKTGNEPFDSVEEFLDNLSRGGEIQFKYKNKLYWITHPKGKPLFYEAKKDSVKHWFESPEELAEYRIDGVKIRDIITNVEILFRCF